MVQRSSNDDPESGIPGGDAIRHLGRGIVARAIVSDKVRSADMQESSADCRRVAAVVILTRWTL